MDRIAQFIVKRSRFILVVTAVVSVLAVAMLFRLQFNADVSTFVLEGNATGEQLQDLQAKYATADPINVIVSLEGERTFYEPEGLALLAIVRNRVSDTDGVGEVASILPDRNPITGEPLDLADLASAIGATDIRAALDSNPVAGLLLDEPGKNTMMLVIPDGDAVATARALADIKAPSGTELILSGNPVVFGSVLDALSLFLLLIPPVVIGLLVLTFYATIGDRKLSALAIVPAALGSLWTFGLIFGLGREVDIVTVIVPIFVVVMGSADGLHFVTHFQNASTTSSDPVARVSSALTHVGVPMILTTVSTAAGFLSLLATGVHPIEQLGLFAAIGIVFAGIISFFSLPALISRLEIHPKHHGALIGPRVIRALKAAVRRPWPAYGLIGLLAGFAVVGLPQLDVDSDQLFFFKDGDPVRMAFERTEELFGGATPLIGEFAYDPESGVEGLAAIAAVSDSLEELSGVREVFSVADIAGMLPADQATAVLSGQVTLPLGDMVSDDGLRFLLLPSDFTTADLQEWLAFAEAEPLVRTLTGMPVVWDEIARLVLRAQLASLVVAFILVMLMLLIAYRGIVQTLVSLIPIALTVTTLLAFIAASGIQLNLMTAVVSSIVLGVGIDYAIHYVAAIDLARKDGPGYVFRAIDQAGRPIVANALGIAVALTALWLSPLKSHQQISMVMWVAMATAALAALLIIPALLSRDGVADEPVLSSPSDPG